MEGGYIGVSLAFFGPLLILSLFYILHSSLFYIHLPYIHRVGLQDTPALWGVFGKHMHICVCEGHLGTRSWQPAMGRGEGEDRRHMKQSLPG